MRWLAGFMPLRVAIREVTGERRAECDVKSLLSGVYMESRMGSKSFDRKEMKIL